MTIDIDSLLPETLTLSQTFLFLCFFSLAILIITTLARLILGKDSSLKHALVSSIGIIVLYGMSVVIYTFNPGGLNQYLAPLPYVTFEGNAMTLFQFASADLPAICSQVLSMLILAFLVNQINSFTPEKLKSLGWLCFRLGSTAVAIFAHYLTCRILNKVSEEYLPQLMTDYAPMILLGVLVFLFSLGFIKFFIGLFLTAVNPVFGGIYTFFFANKVGKNISRAIGTTIALTAFCLVLQHLGYYIFPIGAQQLSQYIPFCVCITLLWVIIGHKL